MPDADVRRAEAVGVRRAGGLARAGAADVRRAASVVRGRDAGAARVAGRGRRERRSRAGRRRRRSCPTAYLRQAPLPLHEPSVPQVAAPWSVHWFSGSCPAGTDGAGAERARQRARRAGARAGRRAADALRAEVVSCTRSPSCRPAPLASLPQLPRHADVRRHAVGRCAVQVVLQVGVAVSHRYGSHSEVVTVWQTPAPSQVRCGVSVDPTQRAGGALRAVGPEAARAGAVAHAVRARRSSPPSSRTGVAGVGAVPLATLLQVPRLPAIAHDLQVPVHAWLQQIPCAQKPESHSFAIVQAVPIGFSVQMPRVADVGRDAVARRPCRWSCTRSPSRRRCTCRTGCVVAAAQMPAPSHGARRACTSSPCRSRPRTACRWRTCGTRPRRCRCRRCRRSSPPPSGTATRPAAASPAAIGEQVPTLPVSEHDMQVPVQARVAADVVDAEVRTRSRSSARRAGRRRSASCRSSC